MKAPRCLLALTLLGSAACHTSDGAVTHSEADGSVESPDESAAEDAASPALPDGVDASGLDAESRLPANPPADASATALLDAGAKEAGSVIADAATAPDAAARDGEAQVVPTGKVPVFVGIGHMGRTMLSCDDGKSWVRDHSLDDSVRCFENGLDCDHTKGAGRGLDYGNGTFVAAFGWGEPGQLKRSRDGVTWTVAKDKTIFAGVAFGHGVFVANATRPLLSSDGISWREAKGELGLNVGNTRGVDWFAPGGGRFLVTGESATTDMVQSKDDGETWTHVGTPPKECAVWTRGAAHNATTVVLASGKGRVCTSTDGGDSWELVQLDADNLSAPVLWTGSEFMTWNRSDVHRSNDGKIWTKQQITPANISIGPVARGPHGTFVAANDGWLVWYEKQQLFRSNDGVRWELLDKSKFKGSHPITFLRFGYADATSVGCP